MRELHVSNSPFFERELYALRASALLGAMGSYALKTIRRTVTKKTRGSGHGLRYSLQDLIRRIVLRV